MCFLLICLLSQFLLFLNGCFYLMTGIETAKLTEVFLAYLLDIKFFEDTQSSPLDKQVKFVLCNHRSFADFFIDSLVVGHCSQLSRMLVAFVLPFAAFYSYFTGRVLYFFRNRKNRSDLTQKILKHFAFRPLPMIFYPEGHRNTSLKSLPLKRGALKIAYEQGFCVQCVLSSSKELVLNEKSFSYQRGTSCFVTRSVLISPRKHETFESFFEQVESQWLITWERLSALDKNQVRSIDPVKPLLRWPSLFSFLGRLSSFCILCILSITFFS